MKTLCLIMGIFFAFSLIMCYASYQTAWERASAYGEAVCNKDKEDKLTEFKKKMSQDTFLVGYHEGLSYAKSKLDMITDQFDTKELFQSQYQ